MTQQVLQSIFHFLFVVELLNYDEEIVGLDMWYDDGTEEEENEDNTQKDFMECFALLSPQNCQLLLLFRSLSKGWKHDVANWLRSAILVAAKGVIPAPIKDWGWLGYSFQGQNFRESGNTICFSQSEISEGAKGVLVSIFESDEEEEEDHSPPSDGTIALDLMRSAFSCREFELNGEEYDYAYGNDGKSFEEMKAFQQGRVFQRITDNAKVSFRTVDTDSIGPEVERDKHEFVSMREEVYGSAMQKLINFSPYSNRRSNKDSR